RGHHARGRRRHVSGSRDAGDLRRGDRRPRPPSGRALREGRRMSLRLAVAAALGALALFPLAGRDYYATLILPFFGYGTRLLGLAWASFGKVEFLTGPFYYYSLAVLVLGAVVMWRIVRSPFGLGLRAIRENAGKAEFTGVDVRRYRLSAFVVAAVFGAVGGALLPIPTGLADPLLAYWTHSGNLVFMLLLGGFGNFFGP